MADELARGTPLRTLIQAADASDPIVVRAQEGALADRGREYLAGEVQEIQRLYKEIASRGKGSPAASAELTEKAEDAFRRMLDLKNILTVGALYRIDWRGFEQIVHPLKKLPKWGQHLKTYERALKTVAEGEAEARGVLGSLARGLDKRMARATLPKGYSLDATGLRRSRGDAGDMQVALDPLVICGISTDIERQTHRWTVGWRVGGSWQTADIDRAAAQRNRSIVELANVGAPINDGNAAEVVEYLAKFENQNREIIPTQSCTGHLGWQPNGLFVTGPKDESIRVSPRSPGEALLMRHWGEQSGTWEGWKSAIGTHVADFPLAMLAIYAALVPPLLTVLNEAGFIVDWSGQTSRGKTSALRVAASVWGVPADKGDGVIAGWDAASSVGPSVLASVLHSLPVLLDDTQAMRSTDRKREAVADLIYAIPAGAETTRGTADGSVREKRTWRTCMLTTGEIPITEFSGAAGARSRALCLRGSPFGSDAGSGANVEAMSAALMEHHGHLGPRFMAALDQDALKERLPVLIAFYADQAKDSVARRMAHYVAMLQLAAEITHGDLEVPGDPSDALEAAWKSAQAGGLSADRPAEALREICAWATSRASQFDGRRNVEREGEPPKWLGRWEEAGSGPAKLSVFKREIVEALTAQGFDAAGVLAAWLERGWIEGKDGRAERSVRINGAPTKAVVIEFNETIRTILDLDEVKPASNESTNRPPELSVAGGR